MSNPVLGKTCCPICQTPAQEVRTSAKGRPYLMCDECDVQIFSRSKRSADAMRELLTAQAPPAPAPKLQPAPKVNDEKPQPAPAAKPAARAGIFGRR